MVRCERAIPTRPDEVNGINSIGAWQTNVCTNQNKKDAVSHITLGSRDSPGLISTMSIILMTSTTNERNGNVNEATARLLRTLRL
jgi:hypothetical protein